MIITIISKPLTAAAATESYRNRSAPDRMLSLFPPEKTAPQPEYTTSGSYDLQLRELVKWLASLRPLPKMTHQKKTDYICVSKESERPAVSSNFVSADFRKMRTDSFQKSRTTRFRKIRVVR